MHTDAERLDWMAHTSCAVGTVRRSSEKGLVRITVSARGMHFTSGAHAPENSAAVLRKTLDKAMDYERA